MPIIPALLKAKFEVPEEQIAKLDDLDKQIDETFRKAAGGASVTEEAKVVA
jgi:hypothetical protein